MHNVINDSYIVQWLLGNPDFFTRQASLLADLRLTSPYSHRAISLQERQLEVLREKSRGLELRLSELVRHGHENDRTLHNLHAWLVTLLAQTTLSIETITHSLSAAFDLPRVKLELWSEDEPTSPILKKFAEEHTSPRCGNANASDIQRAAKLALNDEQVKSLALVPLYRPASEATSLATENPSLGLLILGSYQERQFDADMGTAYLRQIGDLTSAALMRITTLCEN